MTPDHRPNLAPPQAPTPAWPGPGAVAAVAVGAALGSLLRWQLGEWWPGTGEWPWTLWWINLVGAGCLGVLTGWSTLRASPLLATALGPGLMGGFTSVSAAAENMRVMLSEDRLMLAGGWWGSLLLASVAAVWCGRLLAHRLPSGRHR